MPHAGRVTGELHAQGWLDTIGSTQGSAKMLGLRDVLDLFLIKLSALLIGGYICGYMVRTIASD